MINKNKICFITCVNDETYYEESLLYLQNLHLPADLRAEYIAVRNASSMTGGYNAAMQQCDAKYKIYLHQDVFLTNKNFIKTIIELFQANESLGLLGVVGCEKLPPNGIWWNAEKKYGQMVHTCEPELLQQKYYGKVKGEYKKVQAGDGVLMATQYDIPWREDLFSSWHFYDISQSFEFQRRGYQVAVPAQTESWIVHATADKPLGEEYHQFRKIFLQEYADDLIGE